MGYAYCDQSSAIGTLGYLPATPSPIGRFSLQIVGALSLLIACAVFIYATGRKASSKALLAGTVAGVCLTSVAGLILTFAIYNAEAFDPWMSNYAFGVGIYTTGYAVALILFLVHLVLSMTAREVRLLRHLAVFFFAFLTLNWLIYTLALLACS